jgi:Xaa-Pro aminopeptidase
VADRRPGRLRALRDAIAAAQLDGMLVTNLPNIRYMTGFSGSNALLLVTETELHLLTDFRYETQVVDEVGDFARVRIDRSNIWSGLWELFPGVARAELLGFESSSIVHQDFQRLLTEGSRWQWRPLAGVVEGLRESKDEDEVALIEQASGMAVRALHATLSQVRPGLTELQIAGVLEKALRDEGSEGFPFPSIVASGPR